MPTRSAPLPLLLVAAMLAIAVAIETIGYRSIDWLPKLPLAVVLLIALTRSIRVREAHDAQARP